MTRSCIGWVTIVIEARMFWKHVVVIDVSYVVIKSRFKFHESVNRNTIENIKET